jgi:hypothetical protein
MSDVKYGDRPWVRASVFFVGMNWERMFSEAEWNIIFEYFTHQ